MKHSLTVAGPRRDYTGLPYYVSQAGITNIAASHLYTSIYSCYFVNLHQYIVCCQSLKEELREKS